MKAKERERRKRMASVTVVHPAEPARWIYVLVGAAAFIVALWVYSPAMHGPFLFDDTVVTLPGYDPQLTRFTFQAPLTEWLHGVRPALYFTFWLNSQINGGDPYGYHFLNVLFHCITSGLVFLILRRLLEWAGLDASRRTFLAGFGAALFLLHPVQSEAVAYIAGRSESFSVMLVFGAYAVFLYRPAAAISWGRVAAVLLLFGLALLSKEHAIALPALLLLTDYWWNPGFSFKGIRGNWRLYSAMAVGAVAAVASFWKLITTASTAGFGLKDFTWYQYFFTQCRALFVYLGMFLLPARLTADWDFPVSRTILDRGAILGLIALVALAAAAWHYRKRIPLASFGFFAFLLLMAPTSSILPIKDTIAERRLYLALPGLLLIVIDVVSRLRIERRTLAGACAAVLVAASLVTHARAKVWSDPITFWHDTAEKAPNKSRVHFQLAMAYFFTNQFGRAIPEFERAAELTKPDYNLLVDWGLALSEVGRNAEGLVKLRQAAAMEPRAHVYTQIAKVFAGERQWPEALEALDTAQKLDPNYIWTYIYRGKVFFNQGRCAEAIQQYAHALQIDPRNEEANNDLRIVERNCRTSQN